MSRDSDLATKYVVKEAWPRQCFQLSADLLSAVSKEEVKATIAQMKELGICNAPFDQMDIVVPERKVFSLYSSWPERQSEFEKSKHKLATSTQTCIFRYDNTRKDTSQVVRILMEGKPGEWIDTVPWIEECERIEQIDRNGFVRLGAYEIGLDLLDILIVLLATKNVLKESRECKLMKLGIGKNNKQRHRYTTTLKIGEVTERTSVEGRSEHLVGLTRRPHLRRGHIRRQHHGPRNELIKSIWIEPVFVNADPGWIAERTAYNVSMAHSPKEKELV